MKATTAATQYLLVSFDNIKKTITQICNWRVKYLIYINIIYFFVFLVYKTLCTNMVYKTCKLYFVKKDSVVIITTPTFTYSVRFSWDTIYHNLSFR